MSSRASDRRHRGAPRASRARPVPVRLEDSSASTCAEDVDRLTVRKSRPANARTVRPRRARAGGSSANNACRLTVLAPPWPSRGRWRRRGAPRAAPRRAHVNRAPRNRGARPSGPQCGRPSCGVQLRRLAHKAAARRGLGRRRLWCIGGAGHREAVVARFRRTGGALTAPVPAGLMSARAAGAEYALHGSSGENLPPGWRNAHRQSHGLSAGRGRTPCTSSPPTPGC